VLADNVHCKVIGCEAARFAVERLAGKARHMPALKNADITVTIASTVGTDKGMLDRHISSNRTQR
jgi:hypothetical protein